MKIALINPPFVFPAEDEIVLSHCLGLRYISACLKQDGHGVAFIDALMQGFENRKTYGVGYRVGLELEDIVEGIAPDTELIGLSVPFSQLAPVAHDLIALIKCRYPYIPVVMGGVYPSTQPCQALASRADMIVMGEGEQAMRLLAADVKPTEIRGVYDREDGGRDVFIPTELIGDLDSLPRPDDDMPDMEKYFRISQRNDRGQRTASILTSRGCPFQCEFCSIHPVYGRRWRGRSAGSVLSEIEDLHKRHDITALEIEDDNFTMQKQRTMEILEGIIRFNERGCNLSWRTPNGVRIDTIDRDIARLIRRSNCREIVIALEHGDSDMLRIMNKQLDPEKAFAVIRMLVEARIPRITLFVMVGYPGETQARFEKSLDYLRKIHLLGNVSVWVNIVQPYPGTPLLKRCREEGHLVDPNIDNFLEKRHLMSTGYGTPIATPDFDGREVLRRKAIVEQIFSGSHIHLLLCGWFFQGNTGDDLSMRRLTKLLSQFGDLKVTITETFDTELIDWCDILVIGSGSHITPRGISCYRQVKYAKEHGKKILYYAQTIEEGHPLFFEHLSRADLITVRDAESKRVVESHGFRAVLTSDPVFEKQRRTIGCSFRRWVNEPPNIIERLAAVLDELAIDHDVVFLPFTERDTDTESDSAFHEKIIEKMKYKPVQTAYAETIQNIDLLIGMRLHALICAINTGKRVLAIDYDAKVRRIFSDLKLNDHVVPYAGIDKLPDLVREKIFTADHLAQREKANEALVARMCADISEEPQPAISVVMPTYNRAHLLGEAIDSILSQTLTDWELILVDDGSTDDTAALVAYYQDNRIRYYNFGHNGISYARNIGNLLSRGEIIVVADSDDINLPARLEIARKKITESGADIFYSAMFHLSEDGRREMIPSHPFSREQLQRGNFIYHPTVAYRREVAMQCPYSEDLEMVEDYHLYLRASDRGYGFYQEKESLVMHRIHRGQISMERSNEMTSIHEELVRSQITSPKEIIPVQQPLVSVIMPTYNRPAMLKEAIKSVISQTYSNFEIIIINDAGADVSDVINSFNGDERIIYLQHSENKGLATARNTAIRAARGKYIAYLDDDDIYYPEHLKILIGFLESSDYKVAYTDSYQAFQTWITDRYVTTNTEMIYSHDFDREKFLVQNYIPVLNIVHRRDLLEEVGFFDETLGTYEDWDLSIRLSRKHDYFHIRSVTAEFRMRDDATNMTDIKRADFLRTLRLIYQRYSHLVTDVNIMEAQKNAEEYLAVDVAIRQIPSKELFRQVEQYLKKKDRRINNLGAALRDKDAHIVNLDVHARNLEAAVRDKDIHIVNLDVHARNLEAAIEEKNIILSSSSEALAQTKAELNEVYGSTSWRLTAPLRALRRFSNLLISMPAAIRSAVRTNGIRWLFVRTWHAILRSESPGLLSRIISFANFHGANDRHYAPEQNDAVVIVSEGSTSALPELPSDAMKIVVVSHDAHFAGAQLLVLNLIRVLRMELSYEVTVVLAGPGELQTRFGNYGRLFRVSRDASKQEAILSLAATLWQEGYRTAICNTVVVGSIVMAMKKAGMQTISLVHELPDTIVKLGLEVPARQLAAHSDALVFPSHVVQEAFLSYTPADQNNQFILPQGVYQTNPYKDNRLLARRLLRAKLGLPGEQVIVLGVGYGDLRKGIDLFVEVALASEREGRNITFIWLGDIDPNMRIQIESKMAIARNPQNVCFAGLQRDESSYGQSVAGADIFLMTSREDPFPSVVLDAMSVGVPVIGFEGAGGFCEVLRQGSGLLVPYLNVQEMYLALVRLLDDKSLFSSISTHARETAASDFDFIAYVKRLLELTGQPNSDEHEMLRSDTPLIAGSGN